MVLFVATFAFGQNLMLQKSRSIPVKSDKADQTKDLQVIWENDFSTPAEWTMEYSNDNPNDGPWVIGTDAPAGYYSEGMGAIESTTAANGFAMYDSDAIGNNASGTQDSKITYTGTINCTGYTNVGVQFESYYRKFQGTPYLEISLDGTTWTPYEVHSDLGVNAATDNPAYVVVNISTVAANQPAVHIRFRYLGVWDYAWMVDDVKVYVAPDYDVSLIQARINFFPQYINYGYSGFYGRIPAFQIDGIGAPVFASGIIKNYGTQAATPNLNFTVLDHTNTEVYTSSVTFDAALGTEEFDTASTGEPYYYFDPATYGMYTFNLDADVTGVTDENPENNVLSYNTYLTPATWAHDNDNLTGQWSTGNYTSGGIDGDIVGVTYPFFVSCDVNSVDVYIGSMTELGTSFVVKLMTWDEGSSAWVEAIGSEIITLENDDQVGAMHTITFPDTYTVEVPEGELVEILVAVEIYFGGAEFRLGVDATAPTSGWETWLYFSGEDTWYYFGGDYVPIIRMNVGPYSATNTLTSDEINMYPNPTRNLVNFTNVEGANIQIVDLTGKVVANIDAAQNEISFDLSSYAQGTYIVRITNEDGLTIKKVNLVK